MENESIPPLPVSPPATPALPDPWAPGGEVPLDRGLERSKFPPWLTALFVIFTGIILFHLIIGPVATILVLMVQGISPMEVLNSLETVIAENARSLLVANTIGQVLALAVPVILIAGFHSRQKWEFLRLRSPDWTLMLLSVFGLIGLTPIAWWLGNLNAAIPLPDWVKLMEESQLELIEQVLEQNLGIVFSLFVMAVTPAFCEEILFRGYLQRQFERSMGAVWAIIIVGCIFGLFHLRLSQVIPLSVIGMYLAYLTWRSGSLWLAIVIHFANNAFAVVLGVYLSNQSDISLEELERMDVPTAGLVLAFVVLGAAIYLMEKIARQRLAESRVHGSTFNAKYTTKD